MVALRLVRTPKHGCLAIEDEAHEAHEDEAEQAVQHSASAMSSSVETTAAHMLSRKR